MKNLSIPYEIRKEYPNLAIAAGLEIDRYIGRVQMLIGTATDNGDIAVNLAYAEQSLGRASIELGQALGFWQIDGQYLLLLLISNRVEHDKKNAKNGKKGREKQLNDKTEYPQNTRAIAGHSPGTRPALAGASLGFIVHSSEFIDQNKNPLTPKTGEPTIEKFEPETKPSQAKEITPTEKQTSIAFDNELEIMQKQNQCTPTHKKLPNEFAKKAVDAWFDLRPKECPKIVGELTAKRQKKLRALEDVLPSPKPLAAVFYSLRGSNFHRGLEKGKTWKASFNFCISSVDKFYELAEKSLKWIHAIPAHERMPQEEHNEYILSLEELVHA